MSAPRPYETDTFHPLARLTSFSKFNFYLNSKMNANECYLYVILVLVLITAVIAVCFLLFVQSIVIICMARKLNKLRERYVLLLLTGRKVSQMNSSDCFFWGGEARGNEIPFCSVVHRFQRRGQNGSFYQDRKVLMRWRHESILF